MSKRGASNQLTKDNCEEDDPVEEAGHFLVASREELARRPIKTARRKLVDSSGTGASLFSGFKGFTSTPSAPAITSGFGSKPVGTPFSGFGFSHKSDVSSSKTILSTTTTSQSVFTAKQSSPKAVESSPISIPKANGNGQGGEQTNKEETAEESHSDAEFLQKLKVLNKSVLAWAQQHVRENPFIDLMPVFNDYADHLKKLEGKRDEQSKEVQLVEVDVVPTATVVTTPPSKEQTTAEVTEVDKSAAETAKDETNGNSKSVTAPSLFPSFSFGANVGSAPTTTPFGGFGLFNTGASSSTSVNWSTAAFDNDKGAENEDGGGAEEPYVPPKADIVETEEPGSIYSAKCKLFFQSKEDSQYKEKGVGMLHLKRNDNGKVQLLVRAGTATGNILLNVMLNESMPTSRLGKNNVTIVCVPNPPLDPKKPNGVDPTTMLIRVKNSDDADELLSKLNEYKSGSAQKSLE